MAYTNTFKSCLLRLLSTSLQLPSQPQNGRTVVSLVASYSIFLARVASVQHCRVIPGTPKGRTETCQCRTERERHTHTYIYIYTYVYIHKMYMFIRDIYVRDSFTIFFPQQRYILGIPAHKNRFWGFGASRFRAASWGNEINATLGVPSPDFATDAFLVLGKNTSNTSKPPELYPITSKNLSNLQLHPGAIANWVSGTRCCQHSTLVTLHPLTYPPEKGLTAISTN